jgi:hypothetical protein
MHDPDQQRWNSFAGISDYINLQSISRQLLKRENSYRDEISVPMYMGAICLGSTQNMPGRQIAFADLTLLRGKELFTISIDTFHDSGQGYFFPKGIVRFCPSGRTGEKDPEVVSFLKPPADKLLGGLILRVYSSGEKTLHGVDQYDEEFIFTNQKYFDVDGVYEACKIAIDKRT